jgi:proliferating cell nuclear antigen PCNA
MNIQITEPVKCDIFSQVFQHIKLFTEHINITFREEGLYIQTMDNSHVSVFELNIPNTWFDSYSLKEGDIVIGLHSAMLFKVLHSRDKHHEISLNTPDKSHDKLLIDFTSEISEVFNRHYEVLLMEIDSEQLHIPDMEYEAEFTLSAITFGNLIDQLKLFGDTLELNCSEENIGLSSDSCEIGKMTVNIPIEDIVSFAIDEGSILNQSFNLNYLHNICGYSKITKNIDIFLKTGCPIRITYPLDEENCYIRFYLAPKIDD